MGLVPPTVPLLSRPRSPHSPAGTKPDSSPKGSRGLGIRAEFLKQTGTSAPRSPRQDAAVTKGGSRPHSGTLQGGGDLVPALPSLLTPQGSRDALTFVPAR